MVDAKIDFNKRKAEVDIYFSFLQTLDASDTRIKRNNQGSIIEETIPNKVLEILIANGFLILYNLIEATVRNSIIEIYTEIENEAITYKDLSDKLKLLWIKETTDRLREGTFREETIKRYVFDIAKNIIDRQIISLSIDNINLVK